MKKSLLIVAMFGVVAASQAVTIASWGFEVNTPADLPDNGTYTGWLPDVGVGVGGGQHAGAATDWTTPVGNGSANSISSNTYAIGDYYQYQVSTLGMTGIIFEWDQTSSNTGPRDWQLQMSTDGGFTFSNVGSVYVVLANASPNPVWNATTFSPIYHYSVNLSALADNQATLTMRMAVASTVSANGGTVAAGGTSRQDNVAFSGTAVPEPATMAILGLGAAALLRRRRK